jgi:hypothetical protein
MWKNITIITLSLIIFFLIAHIHWYSNDLNWLATLIGATITGLITWLAVYKTAEFDKKRRLYEYRYSHYVSHLNDLSELLKTLLKISYYFEKDKDCIISKSCRNDYFNNDFEIRNFQKTYNYLCKINTDFKTNTQDLENILAEFIDIYQFTQRQIAEHRWYLEKGDPKYKKDFISKIGENNIVFCVDDLLNFYKQEKGVDYDVENFIRSMKNLQDVIENEFVLDNN